MRAVIQRVSSASVAVAGETVGQIDAGLLVLLGVGQGDDQKHLDYIYRKTIGLRIFEDHNAKMNHGLIEAGGQLLVVSQFTLLGDVRKGKRPSFGAAADPQLARPLYNRFVEVAAEDGINVQTGVFGADMQVSLVNDGPVTILLDSHKLF